jgi:hypothetical protein
LGAWSKHESGPSLEGPLKDENDVYSWLGTYSIFCIFAGDKVKAASISGKDASHPLSLAQAKTLLIIIKGPESGYKWNFTPKRKDAFIMDNVYYIWSTKPRADGTGVTAIYDTHFHMMEVHRTEELDPSWFKSD